ncbi:hypothetical protein ACFQ6E_35450 [Streptomyces sp. NPDC056462]|uniref:hypothetical protein n=1 Tax=Streptomyces sp. NPDC056462 TaxID=3345826 RepID=UPI0036769460
MLYCGQVTLARPGHREHQAKERTISFIETERVEACRQALPSARHDAVAFRYERRTDVVEGKESLFLYEGLYCGASTKAGRRGYEEFAERWGIAFVGCCSGTHLNVSAGNRRAAALRFRVLGLELACRVDRAVDFVAMTRTLGVTIAGLRCDCV